MRDEQPAVWLPEENPYFTRTHREIDAEWSPEQMDEDLAQLLSGSLDGASLESMPLEEAPLDTHAPRPSGIARRHRRLSRWSRLLRWLGRMHPPEPVLWLRWISLFIGAVTAAIVAMVSVLGGVISYPPMRQLAALGLSGGLAGWWPLAIFGPWLAATLSILRAALHQRRVRHSWAVVIAFSALAVYLCVAHAPRTVTGMAVPGLPPITALVSFHQLVRQITLTNPPRHALPRQRAPRDGAQSVSR